MLALLLAAAVGVAEPTTIIRFQTDEFWLSLHSFLYVLGRARNNASDARRDAVINAPRDEARGLRQLTPAERTRWNAAVTWYARNVSRRDAVFDDSLSRATKALADARDAESLGGTALDSAMKRTLESAAPVFRKTWWREQHQANEAWVAKVKPLVDTHGPAVLAFITKVYGMEWPSEGFQVHMSGYANWAGAYSTCGSLLVMSSLDTATAGAYGLETVFHEGMHQWDSAVFRLLREQARAQGLLVPSRLSHGMIFMTAGEAVRRVVPGHVPYADRSGVWERGLIPVRDALRAHWLPYLRGEGTRETAMAALIEALAPAPSQP